MCDIFIIVYYVREKKTKQPEFFQIVFGERPNCCLALCLKFHLRGKKN